MGKFDELMKAGANIDESMGAGVTRGPASAPLATSTAPARWQGVSKNKNAVEVPVDKIGPDPDQPREEFDPEALDRLAASLKARGQLQPIRVRWDEGKGVYVIICGERRWRAAMKAGMATMSAVVVEGEILPAELLAMQLVENCLREDLKPVEQAKAFRTLMDRNGWSTRQLAAELAVAQTNIVRALALLDLPESVQEQVDRGNLATSTALEIGKLEDLESQEVLARRAEGEKLTRADVVAARERRETRTKPRRVEIKVAGAGSVVVNLADPEADDDSVLFALQQAAKQFKKAMSSRTEAA
jgi:ParB family transcriptional regulator, chromosome partitioning protein